jgi:hypothetical protein
VDEPEAVEIPLAAAVERWQRETGIANSYEWYRRDARARGRVNFGKSKVATRQQGRRWVVAEALVVDAIAAFREQKAEVEQITADYRAGRPLRGADGETIRLVTGGYRLRGDFHFLWNYQAIALKQSDGSWRCNTCRALARTEHGKPECHRCSDWSPCGQECTLSLVACTTCGTSMTM